MELSLIVLVWIPGSRERKGGGPPLDGCQRRYYTLTGVDMPGPNNWLSGCQLPFAVGGISSIQAGRYLAQYLRPQRLQVVHCMGGASSRNSVVRGQKAGTVQTRLG